eukprot:TRINITY_DN29101_c0_g1_i1.p1 TRINITY_DN29101_c0_g1~~TRINITY_DN29101_c0_g1_i1.p1  ORF type:complete len:413 (-),score=64.22 TRINITY_DN29101_c0_g1_i1:139-1377(-)
MGAEEGRERHRRRRDGGEDRERGGGRRSRSGGRRGRRRDGGDAGGQGQQPPSDWLGPSAGPGRGPPPADWQGPGRPMPAAWQGPHGHPPHGMYPPPHAAGAPPSAADPRWHHPHPAAAPMHGYPPRPGATPWGAPMPGGRQNEPPPEWRGPGMRPPAHYDPRGADPWSRPLSGAWGAPAGAPPAGARPSAPGGQVMGYAQPYGQPPMDPSKAAGPPATGVDISKAPTSEAGRHTNGSVSGPAAALDAIGRGGGLDTDEDEDLQAKPKTMAERLAGIRVVKVALSEATQKKLQSAGVPLDGCASGTSSASASSAGGATNTEAEAAAAAKGKSARLGLDSVAGPRAKMPQMMPTAPRLPVCSVDMKSAGLWSKFRQYCGTPVPAEMPPPSCERRGSRIGGHVLVVPVGTAAVKG